MASVQNENRRTWERQAIADLCGIVGAKVIGFPEDEPANDLTVDALVLREDRRWAVEHTRLTLHSALRPASEEAQRELKPYLEVLSASVGIGIVVTVQPPTGVSSARRRRHYEALRRRVDEAVHAMEDEVLDDGTQILLTRGTSRAEVNTWMQHTADLRQYVADQRAPLIRRKLERQLAPAKAAGLKTLLLCDQQAPPSSQQWSFWLARSPSTVLGGLLPVLREFHKTLDELWLRDMEGGYHPLWSAAAEAERRANSPPST